MAGPAIRTEGLTRFYGRHPGIVDLDLTVQRGEIFGFLGPNGAGKTTTIRLLLDLIRATRGHVELLGRDLRTGSVEARRHVGYLPGGLELYPRLSGLEILRFLATLRPGADLRYARALAGRFDLDLSRHFGELSRGNRQKLGVVQAFLNRPELVVLDEPSAGLDPLVQREFHRLLREHVAAGGTVFMSSHVLSEIQQIADRVGIVRDSRLIVVDTVAGLCGGASREWELDFAAPVDPAPLRLADGVREVTVDGCVARCRVVGPVGPLMRVASRGPLVDVRGREPDLEEVFLDRVAAREDTDAA